MKKILLIEDNESLRLSLVIAFKAAGFTTIEAEDGKKGIKVAGAEKPDLILLDLFLPETDGFKVLEHLRADGATAKTPIVVFSVLSQEGDKAEAKRLGATDYLVKSELSIQQVVEKIGAMLA
ncbi:MAG TPA: response regulator [Patescibacteria group bacterium]|nr:response regulator [Patescibacteria group bacterium]